MAATGKVRHQLKKKNMIERTFNVLKPPSQKETPIILPIILCVDETGIPKLAARMTVIDAPNSIENPLEGEWRVSLLPKVDISFQLLTLF